MFALILVPKVVNSGLILWLICPIGPLSQIGWNVRTDLGSQSCRQWFDPLADLSNCPTQFIVPKSGLRLDETLKALAA